MNKISPSEAEHFKLASGQTFDLNLSGAKIPGAALPNTMLNYADFSGCDLTAADFSDAHLVNANFANAILIDADLSGADLSGANFSGADLSNADVRGAVFNDAVFDYATTLDQTNVEGVDFTKALGISHFKIQRAKFDDHTLIADEALEDLKKYQAIEEAAKKAKNDMPFGIDV